MLATLIYGSVGLGVGVIVNCAADNLPLARSHAEYRRVADTSLEPSRENSRPPARRSLLTAPRCAFCGTPRSWLQQSGLLSFLLRRDRCPACYAPLPLRAPLAEIACAGLYAFLWDRYGLGLALPAYSLFTAILLLIAIIDLEHKLILNVVVMPATLLALALSPITLSSQMFKSEMSPLDFGLNALLGLGVGYGMTIAIYTLGVLFVNLVGRRRGGLGDTAAFGMGDVKLAGFLGALVGFPAIFYVLVYGIVLGGLGALAALLLQLARERRYSPFTTIPYGPYLILAGWVWMIWHRELVFWLVGGE